MKPLLKRLRGWVLPAIALAMFAFAAVSVIEPAPKAAVPPLPPAHASRDGMVGAVGIVEPSSELIAVAPELPGVVRDVLVQAGTHVTKGAPLFRQDARAQRAARETAAADVKAAEAQVTAARAGLAAAEITAADQATRLKLYAAVQDQRAVSTDETDRQRFASQRAAAAVKQARAQVQVAEADLAAAKARLSQIETDLDRLTVTAPIAGRVWRVNVRPGEFAAAGPQAEPLLTIGSDERLHVRVEIAEEDIGRVHTGARAEGSFRGATTNKRIPLGFVRFEPEAQNKRTLAGGGERVDTRVIEALFWFDPKAYPAFAGQRMDVFIDSAPLQTSENK